MTDIQIQNEGFIFLVHALTKKAKAWIQENINAEESTFFGSALVVEHRYIRDVLAGMESDGLEIA